MNLQSSLWLWKLKSRMKIEEIKDFHRFLDCEAETKKRKKRNVPAEQAYGEGALAHSGESGKKKRFCKNKFCKKKSEMCSLCE